ncbi:MAG TPA: efflux RND transporter periplasmic adaptor subunit [Vicinamibacteria bacterium]|nr:efflux RND transporter periplasmic adaptor subunit [Vicinamibacteria bacterium]
MAANLDDLKIDRSERNEPRSVAWLAWAILATVALAGIGFLWLRPSGKLVSTATARASETPSGQTVLNASGYVTARRRATVSSKVTAKVLEVLIEEGMEVREGQILARLDSSNTEASLNLAAAELRAARTAQEETRVQLEEAELQLERTKALVRDAVVSQAELDRVQATTDSLRARLERQREEVEVAERRVAVWKQQLEDTVIRAPFDGIVTTKDAQPGEMISPVSAGGGFTRTGIGTVVDMSSLEIEVDVNESYINRVRPGQSVEATLDAYPQWKIPTRVLAIVPTADRDRATVRVRIGFDELDPRILPEMGVKVAFRDEQPLTDSRRVVSIPQLAVRNDNGRDVVFVVNGERVERRAVTIAPGEGDEAVVLSGLEAGERVVVEGPEDLADGDAVEERS